MDGADIESRSQGMSEVLKSQGIGYKATSKENALDVTAHSEFRGKVHRFEIPSDR